MRQVSTLAIALALGVGMQAAAQEAGFAISIDGQTVAGDAAIAAPRVAERAADLALANAEIAVTADGLGAAPVLAVRVEDAPVTPSAGDVVTVRAVTNYPAFVRRAEVVVYALTPRGARAVGRVPVAPNGAVRVTLPPADGWAMSVRVTDAAGRVDETFPAPLAGDAPTGYRLRRIPVTGGAVTVTGTQVRPGARVSVLGEPVAADASGAFAVQRILPPGEVPVTVAVSGAGEDTYVERLVDIPRAEWTYVGVVDLTFGRRFGDSADTRADDFYSYGRLAGFATGRLANGALVTTRFDSGEAPFRELFRGRDDRDPASVLDRLDYDEVGYATFGDDSVAVDATPSRGKLYARIERDGSHLMWGDFHAGLTGSTLLRDERALYGLQGVWRSRESTAAGEARTAVELFAARPDRLPGRDVLRGTGGSVYFLSRQDLSVGSESLIVEVRDIDSGRVVDRTPLVAGQDYDLNYFQGVVVLSRPLSGTADGVGVVDRPGGRYAVSLVAQYEYTPTAGQLDGASVGGRAEVWTTDRLRLGLTATRDDTALADQTTLGADAVLRLGAESVLRLEHAQTDGPGFGADVSISGGVLYTDVAPVGGRGTAQRATLEASLADLGMGEGALELYAERKGAGFSTLDEQVTLDRETVGGALVVGAEDGPGYRLAFDRTQAGAQRITEADAEARLALREGLGLTVGLSHLDRSDPVAAPDEVGRRLDAAARIEWATSERLALAAFAQGTVDRAGEIERNDRAGLGAGWRLADLWRLDGEVFASTQGPGGSLRLAYDDGAGDTAYLGYELDPARELTGVGALTRDDGQVVLGATRRVTERLGIVTESRYDLLGPRRALVSTHGLDWRASEALSLEARAEIGRITDTVTGDIDRNALSLGARLSDETVEARARLELRRDRGLSDGASQDQDAVLATLDAAWALDDARRILASFDYARIDSDTGVLASGTYVEAGLGYALRPVTDDRLNLLFQYRYLRDLVGQEIDGVAGAGPRQETHTLSVDADYALSDRWTVGGKLGVRRTDSAPAPGLAFASNDAWLGVLNARWQLTGQWDTLFEARYLDAAQGGFSQAGALAAFYRQVGRHAKVGLGWNFGRFSDDLTDLTYDDGGLFLNIVGTF